MKRSEILANRLREVLLNGRWIANTNCKEQIESITWEQAIEKYENLNTIALLTYHINYYLAGLINVLNGGELKIQDKLSFDMKDIKSDEDWKNLVNTFISNAEKFANQVENITDSKLDDSFVNEKYGTYLRNIEAIIEHSYYHLGQISLIKKLIT